MTPALEKLRKSQPEVKLKLHDMSPGEQIDGQRAGELDLALIGQEGLTAANEFHSAKLCSLHVCVAVADGDPLAARKNIVLKELKARWDFIVLWQKGRASAATRTLVDALKQVAASLR